MTPINFANIIKYSNAVLPEVEKPVSKMWAIELRSKRTDIFIALYERLLEATSPLVVDCAHANMEECPLMNGGVAVFFFETKEQAQSLSTLYDLFEEDAREKSIHQLAGEPNPLQVLISSYELFGTHVDRLFEVSKIGADTAMKRAEDIASNATVDSDWHDRVIGVAKRLNDESLTLQSEVDEMIETIKATYSGFEDDADLRRFIEVIANETVEIYTQGNVIESHAALYTDISLTELIDVLGTQDDSDDALIAKHDAKQNKLLNSNERASIVRDNWEMHKKSLNIMLCKRYCDAKHKRLSAPVSFCGLHIGSLMTESFGERLETKSAVRTMENIGLTDLELLASAIVAQLGGYIELKRGQRLRNKRHALAKALVAKESFSKIEAYEQMNRDLEDVLDITG